MRQFRRYLSRRFGSARHFRFRRQSMDLASQLLDLSYIDLPRHSQSTKSHNPATCHKPSNDITNLDHLQVAQEGLQQPHITFGLRCKRRWRQLSIVIHSLVARGSGPQFVQSVVHRLIGAVSDWLGRQIRCYAIGQLQRANKDTPADVSMGYTLIFCWLTQIIRSIKRRTEKYNG